MTTRFWLGRNWHLATSNGQGAATRTFRGSKTKLDLSVLDRVFGAGDSIEPLEPKTRGRKSSKAKIVFPDGEFTIAQVAADNGVEKIDVANALAGLKAHGKTVKVVGKAPKPPGQRGKSANILKFV